MYGSLRLSWSKPFGSFAPRTSSTEAPFRAFLDTEGVTVEEAPLVLFSLALFEAGEADFSDYMILEHARRAQALPLWTFDGPLAQADGAARVP